MPIFQLDQQLATDSLPVTELPLCRIRLMNDRRFPWLLLIPARPDCVEVLDLSSEDQLALWAEIRQTADALRQIVEPDKLNIAALGNQVAQLHVHVIARFRDDAAWPAPVWGVGQAEPRTSKDRHLIDALRQALSKP